MTDPRALANPNVVHFSVYPVNENGKRITTPPAPATQPDTPAK